MLRARTHHTTILIMRATIDHVAVVRADSERSLHSHDWDQARS